MKKTFSILLAALMIVGLFASCAKEETPAPDNTPAQTDNTPAETPAEETPAEETPAEETPAEQPAEETPAEEPAAEVPAEEPAAEVPAKEEGTLIDQMDTWHWRTFECQYIDGNGEFSGWAAGGHYENDEMADFVAANPEWYKDTAMMSAWEEADAPFGDCINGAIAADTPFVSDPTNNHGLMVYKTFNVTNLAEDTLYDFYMFYDNTVYCYVNGEPYFILDGNLTTQDWNGGYDLIKSNQGEKKEFKDFLHEGENYIAVSIKDAWGGREFDAYIAYETGSTKKDVTYIDKGADWQYTVFYAPYIDGNGETDGGAAGGHFEPDEMADYIAAHPDFMTDTATASGWATGTAPMSSGAEGWTGSNHGLMLYKSFNVDSVDAVKDCDEFDWFGDYDNAIHVWLNGVEVYTDDGECVNQDWQSNGNWALDKDLILSTLKDGENYFVVTIKDAWGGRDFNCGFRAHWN